jgi:hypothetical protein
MVLIYGEALSNADAVRRLLMERFSRRQVPCARTVVNAVQHLRDYGTFSPANRDRGRSRSRRVLDLEPEILQAVEEEPIISCRGVALRMGVSSFTIWRTLHQQGLGASSSSSTWPTLQTRRSTTLNCILNPIF